MKMLEIYNELMEVACDCNGGIKLTNQSTHISEELKYHLNESKPLSNNIFRYGSEKYFKVILEAKDLYNRGLLEASETDEEILNTNIGEKAIFEGEEVWLDIPMVNESDDKEDKPIGKPMKSSGNKPYKVYVKNDKGNVITVNFGSGMRAKISDPEARKRYNARHGCSKGKHNDKTKAGYWSCRLPRYASALGLSYKGSAKWW